MELRRIGYFICVADCLSFSKAAEKLHVSHQALSKQIKLLEQAYGVELLERSTTRVSLTEAGRKLYALFYPGLKQCEQAEQQMLEFVKYKKDTLKISFFNAVSYGKVVAPVIQFLMDREPGLRIETFSVDVGQEQKLLEEDTIDVAISVKVREDDWTNYAHKILYTSPLKVIVSDQHPWFTLDSVTTDMLATETLLVYADKPVEGKEAFLEDLPVKARRQVHNMDTYMGILSQGKVFGVVNDAYGSREGTYRLLDLPPEYQKVSDIILVFKRLHPKADLLNQISS